MTTGIFRRVQINPSLRNGGEWPWKTDNGGHRTPRAALKELKASVAQMGERWRGHKLKA